MNDVMGYRRYVRNWQSYNVGPAEINQFQSTGYANDLK